MSSHGVILSGFKGMWLVGKRLHGFKAETQLTSGYYLYFDWNSALVMVDSPEALFLREFDADQNLMS